MQVRHFDQKDLPELFSFWQQAGANVPYFYRVEYGVWCEVLLNFHESFFQLALTPETATLALATEGDRLLGFIQYGRPNFSWDSSGNKVQQPNIGIIRHLYFTPDRPGAGQALLGLAEQELWETGQVHAFFQAQGMSCNAWHGKLFPNQQHVEQLLFDNGFQVEEENPYFVLDSARFTPANQHPGLEIRLSEDKGHSQHFIAWLDGEQVGSATAHPMDQLTGGKTRDVVYLRWIGINTELRRQGLGSSLLQLLVHYYAQRGYRYLHLDTASNNYRARQFYDKHGFAYLGSTRSYIRSRRA